MEKSSDIKSTWSRLTARLSSLSRSKLAWGGLALAAVILLSVNLISSIGLRNVQADMTEGRLFTISDGTREVLRHIDEPIEIRLYYSKRLGELAPSHARYFDRVHALLESYKDLSNGKLEVVYLDPEPFSDEEDRAMAAGLRRVTLNAESETAYFGLTATNSTDNRETIAFLYPDREAFLEYDITKIIHSLAHPKKKIVGVISGLPLNGEPNPMTRQVTPPWLVMAQAQELFEMRPLEETVDSIPADIDILLVAQPTGLTPQAAYAIDQYVLGGGKALVFVDPVSEVTQFADIGKGSEGIDELNKLLKSWGLEFDKKRVAADINHARRVRFGPEGDTVTEYVAWLGLEAANVEQSDVLSAGIENLNLATAGILKPVEGAGTKIVPVLRTSAEAMEVDILDVGVRADPIGLLRNYKPGGKPLILAARISGEAKSAFPDGPPDADKAQDAEDAAAGKPEDSTKDSPDRQKGASLASGNVNVIVVADSDLLADQFWVEERELLGQTVAIPAAHNAAFVIGALENLSGSDALIALRARGVTGWPFTLVDSLRRDAEQSYREKEQKLTQRLTELQAELAKLENSDAQGAVILSDAERQSAGKFREEMLETRRELREVKLALRRDIDRLDGWLKFANIAAIPLAIGAGGIGWSLWRTRRSRASKKQNAEGEDRT